MAAVRTSPAAPAPEHLRSRIYVGNIPWSMSDRDVAQVFSAIGPVREAKVVLDRDTGRSKGFCFVTFETEEAARIAIDHWNGSQLGGRTIKIGQAQPPSSAQPPGPFQGGMPGFPGAPLALVPPGPPMGGMSMHGAAMGGMRGPAHGGPGMYRQYGQDYAPAFGPAHGHGSMPYPGAREAVGGAPHGSFGGAPRRADGMSPPYGPMRPAPRPGPDASVYGASVPGFGGYGYPQARMIGPSERVYAPGVRGPMPGFDKTSFASGRPIPPADLAGPHSARGAPRGPSGSFDSTGVPVAEYGYDTSTGPQSTSTLGFEAAGPAGRKTDGPDSMESLAASVAHLALDRSSGPADASAGNPHFPGWALAHEHASHSPPASSGTHSNAASDHRAATSAQFMRASPVTPVPTSMAGFGGMGMGIDAFTMAMTAAEDGGYPLYGAQGATQ